MTQTGTEVELLSPLELRADKSRRRHGFAPRSHSFIERATVQLRRRVAHTSFCLFLEIHLRKVLATVVVEDHDVEKALKRLKAVLNKNGASVNYKRHCEFTPRGRQRNMKSTAARKRVGDRSGGHE